MKQTKYRKAKEERGKGARHLSIIEALPPRSDIECLRRQYDQHLDQVAGLSEATRSVYWLFVGQFLEWCYGPRPLQLRALKAKDVSSFIHHRAPRLRGVG